MKVCGEEKKGIFVLVKTSNPSSGEFQDRMIDGKELFCNVAEKVTEAAEKAEETVSAAAQNVSDAAEKAEEAVQTVAETVQNAADAVTMAEPEIMPEMDE